MTLSSSRCSFAFKGGGAPQVTEAPDAQPVIHVTGGAFLGYAEGLTTP
jgi:hypothetical protein